MLNNYTRHFKTNLALATPVMLAQAGQITVNVADNVMVGDLGPAALGAVSLGNALFITALVIAFGFSFAMTPLISEADAKNKHARIASILRHGFILNMAIAAILLVLLYIFSPIIGHPRLGQPQDVVELAIPYLRIILFSLLPLMVFQSFRQLAEGISLTVPVMIATFAGNAVNIIFNYGLIYGNLGMPELGVSGAAWGTLISRTFMIIFLLVVLLMWHKSKPFILGFRLLSFEKKVFKQLFRIGLPTSFQMFFEVTAFGAAAFVCGLVGKNDLAAHQIAINLASITFLTCTGIGIAASIRSGNQLGLRDYRTLREVGFSNLLLVAIFMFVCGVAFVALRNIFPTWYIDDPQVIEIAANLLIVAALFQLSDGFQVVALSALRGMQDVNIPTVITFIAYWGISLPIGYLLATYGGWGALGMWSALGLGLTLSASFLIVRFHWKTNRLIRSANSLPLGQ